MQVTGGRFHWSGRRFLRGIHPKSGRQPLPGKAFYELTYCLKSFQMQREEKKNPPKERSGCKLPDNHRQPHLAGETSVQHPASYPNSQRTARTQRSPLRLCPDPNSSLHAARAWAEFSLARGTVWIWLLAVPMQPFPTQGRLEPRGSSLSPSIG